MQFVHGVSFWCNLTCAREEGSWKSKFQHSIILVFGENINVTRELLESFIIASLASIKSILWIGFGAKNKICTVSMNREDYVRLSSLKVVSIWFNVRSIKNLRQIKIYSWLWKIACRLLYFAWNRCFEFNYQRLLLSQPCRMRRKYAHVHYLSLLDE